MNIKRKFKSIITVLTVVLSLGLLLSGCATKTAQQETVPPQETTLTEPSAEPEEVSTVAPTQQPQEQTVNYVMLDINPSIELTVEEGIVTAVQAFNDDGTSIILQSDVSGLSAHDAIDMLVSELGTQGYINEQDEASLVITVSGSENEGLAEGLRDRAEECVKEMNMECEVISATVSDEDIEAAKAIGMSAGRYLIIEQIAEEEGISFIEATEKYGEFKMKELLGMVEDIDEIFEDEEFDELIDAFTEEQQAVLNAAINEYKETVMNAQKAFIQAGKDAQKLFITEKKAAHEAFKADKDIEAWKQAKTELKAQFYNTKSEAKEIAKQAKEEAKQTFLEAISGLGLTDEEIDDLLYFVFDFEWEDIDFDDDDFEDDFDDDDEDDFDDDDDEDDFDDDDDEDDFDDDDDEDDFDDDDEDDLDDDDDDDEDDDDDDDDEDDDDDDRENPGKGNKDRDDDDND